MADKNNDGLAVTQVRLLARIARHLAEAEDLQAALSLILEWLQEECGMHRGVVALASETDAELQAAITTKAIPEARSDKMRYRPGEGVTGRVFAERKPLFVPDISKDDSFLDRSGLRRNLKGEELSFFCIPISYRNFSIGTLSVDKERRRIQDAAQELQFLVEVGMLMAPFVQRRRLEARLDVFNRAHEAGGAFAKLVGKSSAIEELRRLIVKVANAPTTVLLTGETGTGKGVAAQTLHQLSPRSMHPFVDVNCGAIPEALLESELFGHEKGAFTGAAQRRVGVLERAGEGTVFLDEIGELPLSAQTRLLRVLQTREFERVGGSATVRFNARIVAATNRDLQAAVQASSFRADLYYRLNVFPIQLPSLRERGKADILLLADTFAQQFAKQMKKEVLRIDTPAIDMLTAYHWPGNVRELENVMERAVLLSENGVIHGHNMPPTLQLNRCVPEPKQEAHGNFSALVCKFEIELLTEALKDTQGNQTQAAKRLGITKRIIQYKISQYGIDCDRFK